MKTITPSLIAACTGATLGNAATYAPALAEAMASYGISDDARRTAYFLANVGHESLRLARSTESLNYSVEALLLKFGRHRISAEDARRYGRNLAQPANQAAIANCLYGGTWGAKALGNTQAGDGWRFIGRGLIQVTGRANTLDMRDLLRARLRDGVPDLLVQPEALAQPRLAAWSAAAFWNGRGLNGYADRGDFDGACDLVNLGRKTAAEGDASGYEDRLNLLKAATKALA